MPDQSYIIKATSLVINVTPFILPSPLCIVTSFTYTAKSNGVTLPAWNTLNALTPSFTVYTTNNGDLGSYSIVVTGTTIIEGTTYTQTTSFTLTLISSCSVATISIPTPPSS